MIIVLSCTLPPFVQFNSASYQLQKPTTYPTTTACDPSWGPHYSTRSPQILDVNFNARYANGNGRRNGIKMAHINLGSGYLVNNMNNIETIIYDIIFKEYQNPALKMILLLMIIMFS